MSDFPSDHLALKRLNYCIENKINFTKDQDLAELILRSFNDLALCSLNSKSPEALKRALFYIWFAQVEPPYLTGFPTFDNDRVIAVLQLYYGLSAELFEDVEFLSMAAWYHEIADFVFDSYVKYPPSYLIMVRAANIKSLRYYPRTQFSNRGLMSTYLLSILDD